MKYGAAYIALAALSVVGGRQFALTTNEMLTVAAAPMQVSLGTVELAASSRPGGPPANTPGKGPGNGAAQAPFTMTGSISNLKPGQRAFLQVHVTNPNQQAIRVKTLATTVIDASPACTANNLSVGVYDASAPGSLTYVVPGKGSSVVIVPIEFVDVPGANQDACKGRTFPLSFDGTAVQSVENRPAR